MVAVSLKKLIIQQKLLSTLISKDMIRIFVTITNSMNFMEEISCKRIMEMKNYVNKTSLVKSQPKPKHNKE